MVNNMVPKGHKDKLDRRADRRPHRRTAAGHGRVEWDAQAPGMARSVARGGCRLDEHGADGEHAPSNLVCVNGYSVEDGWQIVGMDWDTGEVVHRTIFGRNNWRWQRASATVQFLENGDLLFNSVGGPFHVPLVEAEN